MNPFIYLDHNATTPLDPVVLEAMMPYLTNSYGNASSLTHAMGRAASSAVELAREQVCHLVNAATSEEIYFTSGATEAINTALKGVFENYSSIGKHYITCKTEHKVVLDTFDYLKKKGATVTYLEVDDQGGIDLQQLEQSITDHTVLIALMASNNETGILHPIEEIARIAKNYGILFFCDATQSIGKLPIDLEKVPIDMLCLSGHKMYGPKGTGAIYIRKKTRRIQVSPLLHGGKQENGRRAGTLNVPGIVGLGKAAELSSLNMDSEAKRLEKMRNYLENSLLTLPQTFVNGVQSPRLPHVINVTFRHIKAANVMIHLPHLGMATGSACVSGLRDPSHVLVAMGLNLEDAFSSLRISLGRSNTESDIKQVATMIKQAVSQLRSSSPSWELYQKGMIS